MKKKTVMGNDEIEKVRKGQILRQAQKEKSPASFPFKGGSHLFSLVI